MNTSTIGKWQALRKDTFKAEVQNLRPLDYQDRNWFYLILSTILGYPLQLIAILAGGYLAFDIAKNSWGFDMVEVSGKVTFALCILLFAGVEILRRQFVGTVGSHYVGTFGLEKNEGNTYSIRSGQILKTKVFWLFVISVFQIFSGTMGVYEYIKNNAPTEAKINVTETVSPLETKIKIERENLNRISKDIQNLLNAKSSELKDYKSYAVWQGKEYLLPTVQERHKAYDKQIEQFNAQKTKHQALLSDYEHRSNQKESEVERKNETIESKNGQRKEYYAGITAGTWFVFEVFLVFILSYPWVFKFQVKKELEMERISNNNSEMSRMMLKDTKTVGRNNTFSVPLNTGYNNGPFGTKNNPKSEIGFEKWYEKSDLKNRSGVATETEEVVATETVRIKEVIKEVPVEKIVYVDKLSTKVIKEVETEGFPIICEYCGKSEIKSHPRARFCCDQCRISSWKRKK